MNRAFEAKIGMCELKINSHKAFDETAEVTKSDVRIENELAHVSSKMLRRREKRCGTGCLLARYKIVL
jgi:hypothetical protein